MDEFRPIAKYEVAAVLRDGVLEWTLALQTDDGKQHRLRVRDGEEVPILLDLLRRDGTLYFEPQSGTIRSGWSTPGK